MDVIASVLHIGELVVDRESECIFVTISCFHGNGIVTHAGRDSNCYDTV